MDFEGHLQGMQRVLPVVIEKKMENICMVSHEKFSGCEVTQAGWCFPYID